MLGIVVLSVYGFACLIAGTNLLLMRRPRSGSTPVTHSLCILIPARNEEANLARLVLALREQALDIQILVYDDESTDRTAEIASTAGATVIRGGLLPEGWIGKNWACHNLARAAAEASSADHWLFLDADVRPKPAFIEAMKAMAGLRPLVTGFPQILPGRGIEPLFLAWVGWVLLATNPYGIVSRTGMGHNRFKNGQVHMWRATTYTSLWPHERVKGQIMEDVEIGRLMAREKLKVEVANLSGVLAVRMYETWRQTLDGMSKNSYEISGSVAGSIVVAFVMLVLAWMWLFAGKLLPIDLGLFTLSGVFVALTARSSWWAALFMPINLTIGAFTVLRSLWWRQTGRTTWKGRTYG